MPPLPHDMLYNEGGEEKVMVQNVDPYVQYQSLKAAEFSAVFR